MKIKNKVTLFLFLLLILSRATAAELTGRTSMLGSTAQATQGDIGYINKNNLITSDQQSLRLMLDESSDGSEWSFQVKFLRQHISGLPFSDKNSSDLFRYNTLSYNWLNENETSNATRLGYEIDRAFYKYSFKKMSFAIGRQAIDWGSGRFWQPLNVFGAFAPTDLDTDYKQGIDAARFDWFPSDFSSLTAVYAFSPNDNPAIKQQTNAALHFRKQVGEESDYTLLAGSIIGYQVFGAAFESAWSGIGWRVEGAYYKDTNTNKDFTFLIAGLDYQINNETIITTEWYNNSHGANTVTAMANPTNDLYSQYRLQPQLSQNVLGVSINRVLSPLFNGTYTFLISPLKDSNGSINSSVLHQFNLNYSVSDEAELLLSLLWGSGRGLSLTNKTQSEFGHIPFSLSMRLRFYF
ncbi:MAG TPA: hypothetical protein ENJ28_03775 [Gammaproteobacteria bacterium]|nr:hypothetical protein [Gammaproteobacteria bacterium]